MNTEREMTLSEWCGKLPEFSVVNRELAELRGEIDRLRDMLALAGEDEMGRQQVESDLQFAVEERDALQARIEDSPVVTMKQLAHGIVPSDYAVPWDWNQAGRRVALVVLEAGKP